MKTKELQRINAESRTKWLGWRCTLDGKPALVVQNAEGFPVIRAHQHSVEFCWSTVDRIMQKGGAFKS